MKLKRDGEGGYVTPDGRWSIQPQRRSGGMFMRNGGLHMSKGTTVRTEGWVLVDTTGEHRNQTFDFLTEARAWLDERKPDAPAALNPRPMGRGYTWGP